jgi:parvulin-like peptidyl-prolyl isomerase
MRTYAYVVLGVFFLTATAGCDKLPFPKPKSASTKASSSSDIPVTGTVIAKVNNIPITLEEMNQEIEAYNALVPENRADAKITSREQKVDYVKNQMLRSAFLYQQALDENLDDNDEVQKALYRTKRELMVLQLLRKEMGDADISSQDVEKYYNTIKDKMKKPEERQIREIVLPSESDAKEVLIQLLQGSDFSTTARERSTAASKNDGGNLGFLKPGDKSTQFDAVAFSDSLSQGGISNIFKVPEGYAIIKLEARRGGESVSLSDAYEDIKKYLTLLKQQEKIEELVNKVKSTVKFDVYESEIK